MELCLQSKNLADYLAESEVVNYNHPLIQSLANELFYEGQSEIEKVEAAFHYVRDEVAHSKDIEGEIVTCIASDVLAHKQGICYAKSNLLAAILRTQGIPTGFCYQRLMLFDTPEKGYCIHALNAVYLASSNKWIRLDARGNKPGVNAQLSIDEEKLAFPANDELDEIDYPLIYAVPNEKTIAVLKASTNAMDMYMHHLPDAL